MKTLSQRLTNEEAAAELKVKPDTLDQWRYRRKGPRYYKVGGRIQYKRSDIEAWLEGRAVNPEAE